MVTTSCSSSDLGMGRKYPRESTMQPLSPVYNTRCGRAWTNLGGGRAQLSPPTLHFRDSVCPSAPSLRRLSTCRQTLPWAALRRRRHHKPGHPSELCLSFPARRSFSVCFCVYCRKVIFVTTQLVYVLSSTVKLYSACHSHEIHTLPRTHVFEE